MRGCVDSSLAAVGRSCRSVLFRSERLNELLYDTHAVGSSRSCLTGHRVVTSEQESPMKESAMVTYALALFACDSRVKTGAG